MVGDSCADKSCLLISYTTNAFPGEYIPTVFDNYSANVMVEDIPINLQLFDTAGQEDYKKLRPISYPGTDVFIITFSLVVPCSLMDVETLWVPEIKMTCPNVPYILVGNNSSFRDEFLQHESDFKAKGWEPVTTEMGQKMKVKIGARDYIECDGMKQYHLKEVFESAVKCVLHPLPTPPPKEETKKNFFSFLRSKNKDKKSTKKDDKNSKSSILELSSTTAFEITNNIDNKNLEISFLDSKNFVDDKKNVLQKNMFIDEDDEKYHIIIEKTGQNDYSITYKVIDILTNKVMCKKILIPKNELFNHMKNAIKEFEVLQMIDHPVICKIYGINTSEIIKNDENEEVTTISLFLEYLEYDLIECISKKLLTNTIKVRIIIEIIYAMIYLHKNGIIYRDLKIENIKLDSNLYSKIVDVSLIKIDNSLYQSSTLSQISFVKDLGSQIFMSPEFLNDEEYNNKTDVYSFGMVLYFITQNELPNYSENDKMMKKNVPLPKPSSSISQFCIDLISRCLSFDVKKRPSFEEILIEIRTKSYSLCSNVDQDIVSLRDQQLNKYNYQT